MGKKKSKKAVHSSFKQNKVIKTENDKDFKNKVSPCVNVITSDLLESAETRDIGDKSVNRNKSAMESKQSTLVESKEGMAVAMGLVLNEVQKTEIVGKDVKKSEIVAKDVVENEDIEQDVGKIDSSQKSLRGIGSLETSLIDVDAMESLDKGIRNMDVAGEKEKSADSEILDDGNQESVERGVVYSVYKDERVLPAIMKLISSDLSEPYSIYTYRYFIHNWPNHCYIATKDDKLVGAIVCKLDYHKDMLRRGYIAMLAIDNTCRRLGIGSHLVMKAIKSMVHVGCDEVITEEMSFFAFHVVLEAEITNSGALTLYHNLGFVYDKRLFRYYLNGVEAIRLKLWLN